MNSQPAPFSCHFITFICVMLGGALAATPITLIPQEGHHQVQIIPENLRISLLDNRGETIAPAHHGAGASLNGSALSIVEQLGPKSFLLTTGHGEQARLVVNHTSGGVQFTIIPTQTKKAATGEKPHLIALQFGGMPVAYGLGDAGGYNRTLNLVNPEETTYNIDHNGASNRWLSSFAIFPHNQFAGVFFGGLKKSVTLSSQRYKMSCETRDQATFHYFTGALPQIYKNYQALLRKKGYPIIKPKPRLFELGWESWAALGWQTNADTMLNSITQFQKNGYPIRWAVSGSGFWEDGGTTTSFGKWGEKFPNAMEYKKKLHDQDVKWMIGLRTNFTPPGGPYKPVTTDRDQNLVVDTFKGNPTSQEALDNDYFLKKPDDQLWKKSSKYFPIVPCHILDGNNPQASTWYADLYKKWQVDGIKEDTMMNLGAAQKNINTFNHPVAKIAQNNALVMARCGSFTAPGTLLRINDTNVNNLSQRTPINYLQYAACGAPNVYSDTVGFKQMKKYSEKVVRHAWLLALTSGIAVGETATHWTKEQQEILKRPFDFHHAIVPMLYDAAMKSYHSGYPHTMTPLGIAFPADPQASKAPHFQWMIGDSLLCCPLLKNSSSGKLDVYLPKGTWYDYDTGEKYEGPQLLKDFPMPVTKTPCFIGGAGVLVTRGLETEKLSNRFYDTGYAQNDYPFYQINGERIQISKP